MTNCGGKDFYWGCTCGDCQALYIAKHANSCTWGKDPRVQEWYATTMRAGDTVYYRKNPGLYGGALTIDHWEKTGHAVIYIDGRLERFMPDELSDGSDLTVEDFFR